MRYLPSCPDRERERETERDCGRKEIIKNTQTCNMNRILTDFITTLSGDFVRDLMISTSSIRDKISFGKKKVENKQTEICKD